MSARRPWLDDAGNKLLALLIAIAVWWLVRANLQQDQALRREREALRARARQELTFSLAAEQVIVADGGWQVRPFAPRHFVAALFDEPGLDLTMDQAWLRAHLFFYVLPPAAGDAPARLEWDLHGLSPQLEARLQHALMLRPASGAEADWLVQLDPVSHE